MCERLVDVRFFKLVAAAQSQTSFCKHTVVGVDVISELSHSEIIIGFFFHYAITLTEYTLQV